MRPPIFGFGRYLFGILAALVLLPVLALPGEKGRAIITIPAASIRYDPGLASTAKKVATLVPELMTQLKALFCLEFKKQSEIILIKQHAAFLKLADNPNSIAFAAPRRQQIVIDCSNMARQSFNLEGILRHELGHLLLHTHIRHHHLPRWLDEGLCQWASGGIDEILAPGRARLPKATIRDTYIPLGKLENDFPADTVPRALAYEQSESFITFLVSTYGQDCMYTLLDHLISGHDVDSAVRNTYFKTITHLEAEWHLDLKKNLVWLELLSYHIYEILFTLTALICLIGYIRQRRYRNARLQQLDELDETDP